MNWKLSYFMFENFGKVDYLFFAKSIFKRDFSDKLFQEWNCRYHKLKYICLKKLTNRLFVTKWWKLFVTKCDYLIVCR